MSPTPTKLPQRCPGCESLLVVKGLVCDACGTEVIGRFELPPLARLSVDGQQFVLDFVRCSGNLKEMSQKLKLSYPTVRNMLDEIIETLQ